MVKLHKTGLSKGKCAYQKCGNIWQCNDVHRYDMKSVAKIRELAERNEKRIAELESK